MTSTELLEHALSKVSVIIAVKDDPRILHCLESVDEDVEVVICLNGSPQWMRILLDKQPMQIVVTEIPDTGNLGAAYNAGIAAANGQYLLLMDSDCTFAPGTIRTMAEQVMTNPIVKGLVKYGEVDDIMSKMTARMREFDEGDFVSAQSPPLIYQRAIVKHIGGYHFDPLMHWCEDREFDLRIQLARIPVKFVEQAVIHHDAQIGFSNLRSYWRYGIGEGIGQEQGVLTTPAIPFLWRLADSIRSVTECLLKKGLTVAAYYALTLLVFHSATVYHLLRDPYDVRRRYSPLAKRTRMLSPIREHGTHLTNAQRKRLLRAHAEAGNPIDPVQDLSMFGI
jgi:glycosyltransferase involved in cell wall biosynthesis